MVQWSLKKLKVKDLREYEKNPRQISKEQLAHLRQSITKFNLIDKPVINTDNVIISGHQRLRVLKMMNIKEVECLVPDQTIEAKDMEELNIRFNRNHGEWDWDILANQYDADELVNYGFSHKEFEWASPDDEELPVDCKEVQPGHECPKCGHQF
jgi:ParB-like chromosome segregation protein Spo0J